MAACIHGDVCRAWMRQTGSIAPLRASCPNCPCDDERVQDVEFRRSIVVYYHSLGYNCYITPCNGYFVLVVEW